MTYILADVLNEKSWEVKAFPFQHIYVEDVFQENFYKKLKGSLIAHVANYIVQLTKDQLIHEEYAEKGTLICGLDHLADSPFHIFFSEEWHNKVTSFFESQYTKDVNVSIHVRRKGNTETWIHNDLNPGWFAKGHETGINIANNTLCDYQTGKTKNKKIVPYKTIRSLAMILYINNPPFLEMDGGGTGLYENSIQDINNPSVIIQPKNNSLLLFPCTPESYHAFITNKSHQRCAIVMWFHSHLDHVISKWGSDSIVYWE